ncbi:hypothetical protein WA026_021616 [Henosepilachna vigintioctopunctata]|uniref:Uncharacterized protein n=1 Tax=Henosepilachna vigintioctopunctata TaxID=420089 RepID=A0AAW1UV00_9CUCU
MGRANRLHDVEETLDFDSNLFSGSFFNSRKLEEPNEFLVPRTVAYRRKKNLLLETSSRFQQNIFNVILEAMTKYLQYIDTNNPNSSCSEVTESEEILAIQYRDVFQTILVHAPPENEKRGNHRQGEQTFS